jgi:hypothetical protein
MNTHLLAIVIKSVHILFLWIIFYVAEKVALDRFIHYVYIKDAKPPSLQDIAVQVFVTDSILMFLVLALVYLFVSRIIDEPLMGGNTMFINVGIDMLISIMFASLATISIAAVSQSQSCTRFKDDGLRGTRAFCELALLISVVFVALPYYMLL